MTRNDGFDYSEQIDRAAAGRTVLEHLADTHRRADADEWRARLERGEVSIDGAIATADARLRAGQRVVWHRPAWDEPEVPLAFEVVFEDDDLLAVAKPSGLPTLPGGGFLRHTLLALVRARDPGATPMHRLGRGTSGLVLFARHAEAARRLQAAWRGREVEKRYRALGTGVAAFDELEITAPIGPVPHPLLGTLHAASERGRPSRTVARVLERRPDTTLFEVDIETGRPHQIRIHLAFAGHPLGGDPLYAVGGRPLPDVRALPGDGGYLLHAERLRLRHPTTGALVELVAPPPKELVIGG